MKKVYRIKIDGPPQQPRKTQTKTFFSCFLKWINKHFGI